MKHLFAVTGALALCGVGLGSCTSLVNRLFPLDPLNDYSFPAGETVEEGAIDYASTRKYKKAAAPADTAGRIAIVGYASRGSCDSYAKSRHNAFDSMLNNTSLDVYDWDGFICTAEQTAPFSFRYYHEYYHGDTWFPDAREGHTEYHSPPLCTTDTSRSWNCGELTLCQRRETGAEYEFSVPCVLYTARIGGDDYTVQITRARRTDAQYRIADLLWYYGDQELQILDAEGCVMAAIHSTGSLRRQKDYDLSYTIYDGCPEARREDMRILIGMCCAELNEFCRRIRE